MRTRTSKRLIICKQIDILPPKLCYWYNRYIREKIKLSKVSIVLLLMLLLILVNRQLYDLDKKYIFLYEYEAELHIQTSKWKEFTALIIEDEGENRYLWNYNEAHCTALYAYCLQLTEILWLLVLNVFKNKNLLTAVVMQGSNFSGVLEYWSS